MILKKFDEMLDFIMVGNLTFDNFAENMDVKT